MFSFELDLPVTTFEPLAIAPEGVITGYQGPRKTVLVVDDVTENRAVLVDLLQPLGFTVIEAGNGREALEKARQVRPDLVVTDIVMPEMDGPEATRRMRELPGLSRVPVIIISASASAMAEEEPAASVADAFLSKPIDTEELLRNIATLLRLDWIHAALEDERQPPIDGHRLEQNVTPPVHELQLLHALACEGDMRQIIRWAKRVSDLDERYALFADQVSKLAKHYQSRAVLRLVEQYLDSGG
jgi:CheY-like chemotaxis protein